MSQVRKNIKLTRTEKCLLDSKQCWQYPFHRDKSNDLTIFKRLYDYTGQELEKEEKPKWNSLPTNYMRWFRAFIEFEEPEVLAFLIEFRKKLYRAQLNLLTFPSIHLLCKWNEHDQIGLDKDNYSMEQVFIFFEAEEKLHEEKSLSVIRKKNKLEQERNRHLKELNQISTRGLKMVEWSQREDPEEKSQVEVDQISHLETTNKLLQEALTFVIRELHESNLVNSTFRRFLRDIVTKDKFDITSLAGKDFVFLTNETRIIRQRNVKGRSILQLNDLS